MAKTTSKNVSKQTPRSSDTLQSKAAAKQQSKAAAKQQSKAAAKQQSKAAAKQQSKTAAKQQSKAAAKQQSKAAAKQQSKAVSVAKKPECVSKPPVSNPLIPAFASPTFSSRAAFRIDIPTVQKETFCNIDDPYCRQGITTIIPSEARRRGSVEPLSETYRLDQPSEYRDGKMRLNVKNITALRAIPYDQKIVDDAKDTMQIVHVEKHEVDELTYLYLMEVKNVLIGVAVIRLNYDHLLELYLNDNYLNNVVNCLHGQHFMTDLPKNKYVLEHPMEFNYGPIYDGQQILIVIGTDVPKRSHILDHARKLTSSEIEINMMKRNGCRARQRHLTVSKDGNILNYTGFKNFIKEINKQREITEDVIPSNSRSCCRYAVNIAEKVFSLNDETAVKDFIKMVNEKRTARTFLESNVDQKVIQWIKDNKGLPQEVRVILPRRDV